MFNKCPTVTHENLGILCNGTYSYEANISILKMSILPKTTVAGEIDSRKKSLRKHGKEKNHC